MTLSTTEAEYVAVSEASKEVKFLANLLEVMKISFEKPIKMRIDNVGALFLVKNRNTSERTRHIDSRYHFIRGLLEDGLVEVEFVRSEDNISDIFTKNLNEKLFCKHKANFNC